MVFQFSGSYELLKYILAKYKEELPYKGKIKYFYIYNGYYRTASNFSFNGVNNKVWISLNKDLTIANLQGKIKNLLTLEQLKQEFIQKNSEQRNDN